METMLVASLSKKKFLIVLAAKMRAWNMKMMGWEQGKQDRWGQAGLKIIYLDSANNLF